MTHMYRCVQYPIYMLDVRNQLSVVGGYVCKFNKNSLYAKFNKNSAETILPVQLLCCDSQKYMWTNESLISLKWP